VRLLIADDSPVICERLVSLLNELDGVEIVGKAEDARKAYDLAQKLKPDATILDVRMPRGSGIDVLRDLKKDNPSAVVVMLTNFVGNENRKTCIERGADYVFDKAFEFEKVVSLFRGKLHLLSLNLHKRGAQATAIFEHGSEGRYRVGILATKLLAARHRFFWQARIHVSYFDFATGQLLLSMSVDQPGDPWTDAGAFGFSLFSYSVPEQLPREKKVVCTVTTDKPDPEAAKTLGSILLFVSPMDEGSTYSRNE
jgi:CheY-like chemotaxis protein